MYNYTDEQLGLIIGSTLGDGSIVNTNAKTAILKIFHSIKQTEYLIYTQKLFRGAGLSTSDIRYVDRLYPGNRFDVHLGRSGRELRRLFYPNDNKIITRSLLNKLTPAGIAIWYQDDGQMRYIKRAGIIQGREIRLSTHGFTEKEQYIMKKYFSVVWDVEFRINRDRQYYYLICAATQAKKFFKIIDNYIDESMLYKFDFKYKNNATRVISDEMKIQSGLHAYNEGVELAEMTNRSKEL